MSCARRTALLAALLLLGSSWASAEGRKHALLVGVGRYTYIPSATLEGPPYDVRALQRALTGSWGFDPANVSVLLDADATRSAILAAIDRLVETTQPSDVIFIYFSGHGTSGFDRTFQRAGIDGNSGALIPSDFRPGPPERLSEGLIIGSRDLRPRFEKLEKDRTVFVVFDSCFSGNAARMVFAPGKARYVPATDLVPAGASTRALEHVEEEEDAAAAARPAAAAEGAYPYRNVLYISAASKSEKAMDIDSRTLKTGRVKTLDDQPHGALTNALLEGLAGAADTNQDRQITYGELYQYAKDRVMQAFPHQPQLLSPPAREDLLDRPVMGASGGAVFAGRPAATGIGSLRVRASELPPEVARRIGAIRGVALVTADGGYDLRVTHGVLGFKLYHASGDELATYGPAEGDQVVERIARQAAVQELIDLTYAEQDFNVKVEIPGNRGFLKAGEPFRIEVSAETDSHLLLFNVDSSGFVSVLYPFTAAEAHRGRRAQVPPASETLRVSPPFGTEYLKVVAFVDKPAGFDRWIEAGFSPTGPELRELLAMLKTAKGRKAQARLKVVTRSAGS